MTDRIRIALVQMTSSETVADNVAAAVAAVDEAAGGGADLVATPEMTSLVTIRRETLLAQSTDEASDPALAALRVAAHKHSRWLLIGSLPIKIAADRVANRSFLIAPDGMVAARYDKIHMFDVDLDTGESYRESQLFAAGSAAVVAPTPWGMLGLSICYDLRFPGLYRQLAHAGAKMIAVPAAFTRQTGEAHWRVLLRARAIENGCFILAPAQSGRHATGRETYGHSMVVDPWGRVLVDAEAAPGVVFADLDLREVDKARSRIPSLRHDRPFMEAGQ